MNFTAINQFTVTSNELKGCSKLWVAAPTAGQEKPLTCSTYLDKSRKLLFFCLTIGPSDKQNRSPPKLLEVQEVYEDQRDH